MGLTAAAGRSHLSLQGASTGLTLGQLTDGIRKAIGDARRDPLIVAAAGLALVSAVVIGTFAGFGLPGAMPIGLLLPGLVAAAGGAAIGLPGTVASEAILFRRLVALAMIIWALGQMINGVVSLGDDLAFPSTGDLISLAAAPPTVLAILVAPWPGRMSHSSWRLGLDAALLGVALGLPLWHFWFARLVLDNDGDAALIAALVVVVEVGLVCAAGLAFLREFDGYVLVFAAGIACFALGDMINVTALLGESAQWSPGGAVLWALGWPLMVAGLMRFRPRAPEGDRAAAPLDLDSRGVMTSTTVSLALVVLTLAAMTTEDDVDRISLGLVIVTAVVFWARELLNWRFRAQLLRELHAEATADPLTGLANRRVLADRMEALSQGDSWCLLTVDLDGFKDVNDLLGHGTGDKLLAAVAGRLREAAPADALVSRIGGDEFAILLPGDIEAGARVGAAIVTAVRQSAADVEGVARVEVSASVGVAAVHGDAHQRVINLPPAQALPPGTPTMPPAARVDTPPSMPTIPARDGASLSRLGAEPVSADDAELAYGLDSGNGVGAASGADRRPGDNPTDPDALHTAALATPEVVDPLSALSASSAALRVAKAAGRNRVEIYDAGVAQIRRRRLRVEERLRSAVETGAITVQYQPIIDLRRGQMAGCEALARWTDPELGRVDPGEFITVAEQTGLVVAIGERVLEETLRGAVAGGLFERGLRVSCNVSPVQLRVAGFDRVVQEAIAAHGVPREQLVIEVTEQVLVEEGQAAQTLHRLAGLGLTIAIDDFGTGYSALGYLQRLPADILKIDRSLTSSLIEEPRSRAITRAVVDLGRTVGLSVVVEGVESSQVDDLVRKMGVGFGQGLYYGAAMEAREIARLSDRLKADPASD